MNDAVIAQLKEIQKKIDAANTQLAIAESFYENAMTTLKNLGGYETIEEAEEALAKQEKILETRTKKLEEEIQTFLDTYKSRLDAVKQNAE